MNLTGHLACLTCKGGVGFSDDVVHVTAIKYPSAYVSLDRFVHQNLPWQSTNRSIRTLAEGSRSRPRLLQALSQASSYCDVMACLKDLVFVLDHPGSIPNICYYKIVGLHQIQTLPQHAAKRASEPARVQHVSSSPSWRRNMLSVTKRQFPFRRMAVASDGARATSHMCLLRISAAATAQPVRSVTSFGRASLCMRRKKSQAGLCPGGKKKRKPLQHLFSLDFASGFRTAYDLTVDWP